jgi:hypothetical protein
MHTKPKFLQHDKRIIEWAPLVRALAPGREIDGSQDQYATQVAAYFEASKLPVPLLTLRPEAFYSLCSMGLAVLTLFPRTGISIL